MEYLWREGSADVKAVHRSIGSERGITLNTIQSTIKRLHSKGLLARRKVSHAYIYSPAQTRAEFHRDVLNQVVVALMDGEPDAMLAAFVDVTERAGPEHLERLEQLVASRLGSGGDES